MTANVGTYRYMAPEVRGERYGPACDAFSVGKMLDEDLCAAGFRYTVCAPLLRQFALELFSTGPTAGSGTKQQR